MSSNLKIFALGGLHEVGKNCYVLEKNEDIIIVDCGIKFLNGSNLADGTIPNFSYLLANREKIRGLFITHGHEDHIGGIPYLLQLIPNIPVYGSAFSISLLKSKLGKRTEDEEKRINIFQTEEAILIGGEFRVSFFQVTHSIPGSFGLVVEVLREEGGIERKLLDFVKRNEISKIILSKDVENLMDWNLSLDYSNGSRKILTSSQSRELLPNFSELRIIDVKNYKKVGKNLSFVITKQALDDFLFGTRIVITGDFKFDWTEIGEKFDLVKLVEWGKKGVDLLLSDSTNAEVEGSTPSESKIVKRLESIIREATGRVIITSFASNVYRLKKVIEIAKKTDKKIVLLGSSLRKMKLVIVKTSLWKIDKSVFLEPKDIAKTPEHRLIIFCTGSQGEEKAVLSRLAHESYPDWKITAGDSIILTSSPIMDNKLSVEVVSNKLFALGAKVYENSKEDLLHASGHACQEDLKLMLTLVKPRYFMPFHGDFRMLKKHGHLAQELGIPEKNIFVCDNGEVVEAKGKEFFLSKKRLPSQPNYVLNGRLLPLEELNNNLTLREKMSQGGFLLVVIFYDQKRNKLTTPPYIFTYGFVSMKKNEHLINDWKLKISELVMNKNHEKETNWDKEIKNYMESELLKTWSKEKPLIHTMVEYR